MALRDLADRVPPAATAPPLAALLLASTAALRARMSLTLSRRGACFAELHSSCGREGIRCKLGLGWFSVGCVWAKAQRVRT